MALGKDIEDVRHWTTSELSHWVAYIQLRDEALIKARGKKYKESYSDTAILMSGKEGFSASFGRKKRRSVQAQVKRARKRAVKKGELDGDEE